MKRMLLCLNILGVLIIPAVALGMTVSVSNVSGYPGTQNIPVAIRISGPVERNIIGVYLELDYSAGVAQAVNVTKGKLLNKDWNLVANTKLPGKVKIALYSISGLPNSEGTLAQIHFNINKKAPALAVSKLHLVKATFNEKYAKAMNDGSLTVSGGMKVGLLTLIFVAIGLALLALLVKTGINFFKTKKK